MIKSKSWLVILRKKNNPVGDENKVLEIYLVRQKSDQLENWEH